MTFLKTISPNENGSPATDQELLDGYRKAGDLGILAQLYQRYLDLLYGVCLKYFNDREMAKDAVMDIFEELPPKLARHEVGHFKAWLYTVAKNHCLMQLRASGRLRLNSLDPDLVQMPEETHLNDKLDQEARLDQLSDCISTLSADQKTVVSLFYLENKCYKEIECATGFEWNRVRSLIQNGRRNLRLCMERQEGPPTRAGDSRPAPAPEKK
ncbi:MAG TPA: sigma-70 family RNA polymerase sigma factor [Puia sp.]|nr:sigma-70 family RNA polymerase sigma factor [Puia sp.]